MISKISFFALLMAVLLFFLISCSAQHETNHKDHGSTVDDDSGNDDAATDDDSTPTILLHSHSAIYGFLNAGGGSQYNPQWYTFFKYNGYFWKEQLEEQEYLGLIRSIWGANDSNVFAVGWNGGEKPLIMHFDGDKWHRESVSQDEVYDLYGVYGSSADNVYAVGHLEKYGNVKYVIYHYDGQEWERVNISHNKYYRLYGVWCASTGEVFSSGYFYDSKTVHGPLIVQTEGEGWNEIKMEDSNEYGCELDYIWGSSAEDVFAVGNCTSNITRKALIMHYDGTTWSNMYDEVMENMYPRNMSGTSGSEVYVVGGSDSSSQPRVLYYDGVTWTRQKKIENAACITGYIDTIWDASPTELYIAADCLIIYNNLGNTFKYMDAPPMDGIWVAPSIDDK